MKFDVLRRHQGEKLYDQGDTREANEADVVHLVRAGVLRPSGERAGATNKNKAEPKVTNKKAPASKNKAG